jgi:two-component system response regulator CpxR
VPIITLFSGDFCKKDLVLPELLARTGYKLVNDKDIVEEAARISGMAEEKINRAFSAKTSVFNKFTHEKEHALSYLKLALSQKLSQDRLLIDGLSALLVPKEITHVLRICLIADMKFRASLAGEKKGLSQKEAIKFIHKQDEERAYWVDSLFGLKDPWDTKLYDMVISMDKTSPKESVALVSENLAKDVIKTTEASKKAIGDFLLAANVGVTLAQKGHNVDVSSKDGSVIITINKQVLRLSKLEEELRSIATQVAGVQSVETKVNKDYYKADIYRKYDFEMPSKVLLVDDEREFVTALSERFIMRDMGSAVAYDGESALQMISTDEPEVMVLDLRMPGIDGIEVLRRVKKSRPDIEVIILTGHGDEKDRKICVELGAFAYLQKPVDIDLLTDTLKRANEKVQKKKGAGYGINGKKV